MRQIGFALIDETDSEVMIFGAGRNDLQPVPNIITLPNDDRVHAASVGGVYNGLRLVERWLQDEPPSKWHSQIDETKTFDGTKMIVTVVYETTPSIVPQTVTAVQARLALLGASLLDQVTSAVAASTDQVVKIEWEYAIVINRTSPFITAVGTTLNLTSDQIDNLFRAASEL